MSSALVPSASSPSPVRSALTQQQQQQQRGHGHGGGRRGGSNTATASSSPSAAAVSPRAQAEHLRERLMAAHLRAIGGAAPPLVSSSAKTAAITLTALSRESSTLSSVRSYAPVESPTSMSEYGYPQQQQHHHQSDTDDGDNADNAMTSFLRSPRREGGVTASTTAFQQQQSGGLQQRPATATTTNSTKRGGTAAAMGMSREEEAATRDYLLASVLGASVAARAAVASSRPHTAHTAAGVGVGAASAEVAARGPMFVTPSYWENDNLFINNNNTSGGKITASPYRSRSAKGGKGRRGGGGGGRQSPSANNRADDGAAPPMDSTVAAGNGDDGIHNNTINNTNNKNTNFSDRVLRTRSGGRYLSQSALSKVLVGEATLVTKAMHAVADGAVDDHYYTNTIHNNSGNNAIHNSKGYIVDHVGEQQQVKFLIPKPPLMPAAVTPTTAPANHTSITAGSGGHTITTNNNGGGGIFDLTSTSAAQQQQRIANTATGRRYWGRGGGGAVTASSPSSSSPNDAGGGGGGGAADSAEVVRAGSPPTTAQQRLFSKLSQKTDKAAAAHRKREKQKKEAEQMERYRAAAARYLLVGGVGTAGGGGTDGGSNDGADATDGSEDSLHQSHSPRHYHQQQQQPHPLDVKMVQSHPDLMFGSRYLMSLAHIKQRVEVKMEYVRGVRTRTMSCGGGSGSATAASTTAAVSGGNGPRRSVASSSSAGTTSSSAAVPLSSPRPTTAPQSSAVSARTFSQHHPNSNINTTALSNTNQRGGGGGGSFSISTSNKTRRGERSLRIVQTPPEDPSIGEYIINSARGARRERVARYRAHDFVQSRVDAAVRELRAEWEEIHGPSPSSSPLRGGHESLLSGIGSAPLPPNVSSSSRQAHPIPSPPLNTSNSRRSSASTSAPHCPATNTAATVTSAHRTSTANGNVNDTNNNTILFDDDYPKLPQYLIEKTRHEAQRAAAAEEFEMYARSTDYARQRGEERKVAHAENYARVTRQREEHVLDLVTRHDRTVAAAEKERERLRHSPLKAEWMKIIAFSLFQQHIMNRGLKILVCKHIKYHKEMFYDWYYRWHDPTKKRLIAKKKRLARAKVFLALIIARMWGSIAVKRRKALLIRQYLVDVKEAGKLQVGVHRFLKNIEKVFVAIKRFLSLRRSSLQLVFMQFHKFEQNFVKKKALEISQADARRFEEEEQASKSRTARAAKVKERETRKSMTKEQQTLFRISELVMRDRTNYNAEKFRFPFALVAPLLVREWHDRRRHFLNVEQPKIYAAEYANYKQLLLERSSLAPALMAKTPIPKPPVKNRPAPRLFPAEVMERIVQTVYKQYEEGALVARRAASLQAVSENMECNYPMIRDRLVTNHFGGDDEAVAEKYYRMAFGDVSHLLALPKTQEEIDEERRQRQRNNNTINSKASTHSNNKNGGRAVVKPLRLGSASRRFLMAQSMQRGGGGGGGSDYYDSSKSTLNSPATSPRNANSPTSRSRRQQQRGNSPLFSSSRPNSRGGASSSNMTSRAASPLSSVAGGGGISPRGGGGHRVMGGDRSHSPSPSSSRPMTRGGGVVTASMPPRPFSPLTTVASSYDNTIDTTAGGGGRATTTVAAGHHHSAAAVNNSATPTVIVGIFRGDQQQKDGAADNDDEEPVASEPFFMGGGGAPL